MKSARLIPVLQYILFALVLLTCVIATTNGTTLQRWYEVSFQSGQICVLDFQGDRFPQSCAHSSITVILLLLVYMTAIIQVPRFFEDKLKWNGESIKGLGGHLRDAFFSRILISPFAAYLESNFSTVYEKPSFSVSAAKPYSVSDALVRYFMSKPSLAMAGFELVLVISLFVFTRDVGEARFFVSNTILIFLGSGLLFKLFLLMATVAYKTTRGIRNG